MCNGARNDHLSFREETMHPVIKSTFKFVLIAGLVLCLSFAGNIWAASETYRLDNGMEIILKPSHNAPMIASVIFVKAGAKYESTYENGITHFLEHLLFDGTTHLTRQELDRSITDLGGYINAQTQKDFTVYLVLMPKQYIGYGMAVQTDMLFSSIFPDSEMTKERQVVIEEIRRDADAPGAPADEFFTQKAYGGTPYSRPVLGYPAFIENIPREAVIQYWKKYYEPSRMTALIIGDFEPDSMKAVVSGIFGKVPIDTSAAALAAPENVAPLAVQKQSDTVAAVNSTYVNFSFPAPRFGDPDYMAFDLLAQYLSLDEVSPLMRALKGGADPLATDVTVSLSTYQEFSRLDISAVSQKPEKREAIVRAILDVIENIKSQTADPQAIEGIKTSVLCQDIFNAEKLHYYAFMIAPRLMTTGWDFVQTYPTELGKVTWDQCSKAAEKWLSKPAYVVTTVGPAKDSTSVLYKPEGLTADDVINHFKTATFTAYDVTKGIAIEFPSTAGKFDLTDKAEYHREVLANGLAVIVKSSPDSRVFAVDILGKNRSANEPDGKTGISDFVNRCLEKGTLSRSAADISRDLAKIGANLTLCDNPWIPYDDRYTTPQYTFVKLETIDDFARTGLGLLADMLLYPAFDSVEVEQVRNEMLGIMGRDAASPGSVARKQFYTSMFGDKVYGKPVMGSMQTISGITVADLRAYHAKFYAPQNTIVAIATNKDIPTVMGWVNETLGRVVKADAQYVSAQAPDPVAVTRQNHTELAKEQMAIYLGSPVAGTSSPAAVSLEIATAVLSDRLASNLREKQGLAYSVGAGIIMDTSFGWYYCSMGTSAKKYQQAFDGIILEIDKLRLDGPTDAEVNRARNQIWGRMMMTKLSRINQAFYMAQDEYLGRPTGYDRTYFDQLMKATVPTVMDAASKYFRTDAYVLSTAGKKVTAP
jgi:zinc protease